MTEAALPYRSRYLETHRRRGLRSLNATLITLFRLPPFICTPPTNAVFVVLIYITTTLVPVSNLRVVSSPSRRLESAPVPLPILILIPIAVGFTIMATKSFFGQRDRSHSWQPGSRARCRASISRVTCG
jgi:hypothetical protein